MMEDLLLTELGARIRSLRKAENLSQEKLSERAGLHPTYLAQIERGEVNPSFNVLYKIADGLKISLSELFSFLSEREEMTEENLTSLRFITLLSGKDKKTIKLFEAVLTDIIKWMEEKG
ncbi:MAG: helix-turn-helix transcriptional regulator [bacterium]